jgi:hypothetical protein
MNAEEKARELYLQMLSWQSECHKYLERNIISTAAKKCALIAVDEIIYLLDRYIDPVRSYWEDVKREINKL